MRILLIFLIGYFCTLNTLYSQSQQQPTYTTRQPPSNGVIFHKRTQVYRTRSLERTYKFKTRIPRPEEKIAQKRIQAKLKAQHLREQQILREQQKQRNLEFGKRLALKQARLDARRPIRQSQAIRDNIRLTSIATNKAILKRKKKEREEKRQSFHRQSIFRPKPAHIPFEFRLR